MGGPRLEVADVFRRHGPVYRHSHVLSGQQRRAMRDIEACRTSVLGGHLDVCGACGHSSPSYNSCRNRHCPKCQSLRQAKWVAQREQRLLDTPYFHVVFTVPEELKPLALLNRERFFKALFQAVSRTLLTLANDERHLGAIIGITTVLHTWTRDLRFHPHVHCIVTGGGLAVGGKRWIPTRRGFLFPVRVLSRLFRGKLLGALARAIDVKALELGDVDFPRLRRQLRSREWVVYSKRPFGGPEHVLRYLGRYTHRVGISNQRLLSVDEVGVRFRTRGEKNVYLQGGEFIRRFLQHVLPKGFFKIRHYGLLAPSNALRLRAAQALLARRRPEPPAPPRDWRELLLRLTGIDLSKCPRCGAMQMRRDALPLPDTPVGPTRDVA
jgi:hypothetical protein